MTIMTIVAGATVGEFLLAVLVGKFLAGAERVNVRSREYVPEVLANAG